jgi:NADPH:quinone reductase
MTNTIETGLQMRTLMSAEGMLTLSLVQTPVRAPGPEEICVRLAAAPVNPSDLGLLIGPADLAQATTQGDGVARILQAPVAPRFLGMLASRLGQSMPVGNEGAGIVVAAGESAAAQALLGRTVAVLNGATYAQFATVKVADALVMAPGTTPRQAASCFVNPLTSLGMVETMKREGHSAIVHTAAASNLGQMLSRLCAADGIGLVNVVRSGEQEALLRAAGAVHVVNSSAANFNTALTAAIDATGATIAFDAIGGGRLGGQILSAMEVVASKKAAYSRYGSSVYKQLYIYGGLDTGPTEFSRSFGLAWGIGGWLLTPFLQKIGSAEAARLRERVANEITTTFASHYTDEISLTDALNVAVAQSYNRKATGAKYLINPALA